jgi:hypothetical protein
LGFIDDTSLFRINETTLSSAGSWTEEEDQMLRDQAMQKGVKAVKKAAVRMDNLNKTEAQCQERWKELVNPPVVKRLPWSKEEDEMLVRTVGIIGAGKWTIVASYIHGRAAKQCRYVCTFFFFFNVL